LIIKCANVGVLWSMKLCWHDSNASSVNDGFVSFATTIGKKNK
jgi:hypothetical protein